MTWNSNRLTLMIECIDEEIAALAAISVRGYLPTVFKEAHYAGGNRDSKKV